MKKHIMPFCLEEIITSSEFIVWKIWTIIVAAHLFFKIFFFCKPVFRQSIHEPRSVLIGYHDALLSAWNTHLGDRFYGLSHMLRNGCEMGA